MSFQDPPRRQRQPRYPALAQYEDGYPSYQDTNADHGDGNGYQGFAGLAGAPRQRPPWDDPRQQSAWDTGAQWSAWGTGAQPAARDSDPQRSLRDTGARQTLWDSGANRALRDTGTQQTVPGAGPAGSSRNTGAHRSLRNTGGQRSAWDTAGQGTQGTEWDAPRETDRGLPRRTSGAFRAAGDDPGRPAHSGNGHRRAGRGLLPGALAGFLAAAVALGVANLVAAFVRPQASPIIAVGGAFIDRTPSALKNFAVQKFGENDKNMLLLGMYVTIAFIAIAIGMAAWRRLSAGVAGIGLFGLFGAFVAITRPESHVTDVIPSIVGGIAGIAAIVWLVQAGMPRTRPAWARGR